jgi:hypothetical protein
MRALSLWQPWAHAVVHLGKRVENRQWRGCSYRGPFLIHASKGYGTRDDFDSAVDTILDIVKPEPGTPRLEMLKPFAALHVGCRGDHHASGRWLPAEGLQRGGIVGACVLDGVITNEADFAAYAANRRDADGQRAWWFGGFALALRDVIPLPFRQWKGEQGWFDVPWARPVMSGDGSRLLGVDWSEP